MPTPILTQQEQDDLDKWRVTQNNPDATWEDFTAQRNSGTNAGTNAGTSSSSSSSVVNSDSSVVNSDNIYQTAYKNDLATIGANRKYLIGNAVGQGLLNMTNLAQGFKKMPQPIGIGNIPRVQYPNVTAGMTADLNASLGHYRGGVKTLAGEKGLSPEMRIGAEGNALNSELEGRAKISGIANENKVGEINANSAIGEKNISNQNNANWANTERNDKINGIRSGLFSQGLTNLGKIGASVAEGNIALNNQQNSEWALNQAMQQRYKIAVQNGYSDAFEAFLKKFQWDKYVPVSGEVTTGESGEKVNKYIVKG